MPEAVICDYIRTQIGRFAGCIGVGQRIAIALDRA